jgi:hypothetical protein
MSGNIGLHILPINRQHPNHSVGNFGVVDDPNTSTFASTGSCLADLPNAAGSGNHRSRCRIIDQRALQGGVRLVGEVIADEP